MSSEIVELPEWSGGGCQNARCPGSGKHRILSEEEVERVYPIKDKFSWWPLPPQATHVCTVCGFAYGGVGEPYQSQQQPTGEPQIRIDLDRWEWSHDEQFEGTVREAVESFVRGAPDDATTEEIATGVNRYVAGADYEFARDVMMSMDDYEEPVLTMDEFM